MTICVIPARGGSTRIPFKNGKLFGDKPIVVYSILAAFRSRLFDKVVVSTDSDALADIAMNAGARVWRRKPKYARDEVGTQEVVRECLSGMGVPDDEVACCLYATAPLLSVTDLAKGYQLLRTTDASFVMSVGYGAGALQDAGQFYWGHALDFMAGTPLINETTRLIRIADERVCDINTMDDWAKAYKMYEALKTNDAL